MIWVNKTEQIITPSEAFSDPELARSQGFVQLHSKYESRLLKGEKPNNWNTLQLPDRKELHKLASDSDIWLHISTYAPIETGLLFTALTASSELDENTILGNVRKMMTLVITRLGETYALSNTQSTVLEDGKGITMVEELETWLHLSHMGFSYNDLLI